MAIDAQEPGSPDWWLIRLGKRLEADRPRIELLEAYHRGDPPLPYGNRKMRDAYRALQRMARANFAGLVVEAVLERLTPVGFSTGSGGDDNADRAAWATWQRNSLDADIPLVLRQALAVSRAYMMVGQERPGRALITPEDAKSVIHESDPTNRRRLRAGMKCWLDDVTQRERALVMLPEGVVYYSAAQRNSDADAWNPARWERDTSEGDDGVAASPTPGLVPLVPFIGRPSLDGDLRHALGEFEDVTDILDRINKVILDRMVISAMQAYRQRWATGVLIDDQDFDPGADLLWNVENPDVKFGEFQVADLRQVLEANLADIRQVAAITRTPAHYFVGELNNVNGETLKATETGLVAKGRDRMRQFGESCEQVNRLAGLIEGREVADDAETIWADPQSHSVAELYDAAVKAVSAGEPWSTRMRLLGHTPQEIDRMQAERAAEQRDAADLAARSFGVDAGPVEAGAA